MRLGDSLFANCQEKRTFIRPAFLTLAHLIRFAGHLISPCFLRTSALSLLLLLLSFLPSSLIRANAQDPIATSSQTIRLEVPRVNVGVIVTNPKGQFVRGLKREDFHVFDNNVEQPITEFATVDEPAQVLLLVEAGPAVFLLQDAHIFAAEAMLRGLSPSDQVAIARYDVSPAPILPFTTDKVLAQAALSGIRFNLGFSQLNLSSSLNTVLDWLASVPGKKTVVLLSTGIDTSPSDTFQSLQSRLQAGDIRLLCISVSGPIRNGKIGSNRQLQELKQDFAQGDSLLRSLADGTGGRVFFPEDAKAIQEIYGQIAQLVRNEYSLAFVPPTNDGAVHSLKVKVNLPLLSANSKSLVPAYRVDHRKAYVAPQPNP
jgi:Ca-activated chloride channel homolog